MTTFILNFFQDHSLLIFFGSLLAIIIGNFFATTYRIPVIIIAILCLSLSVYLKGGQDERVKSDEKIAKINLDSEKLKVEIEKLNTERNKISKTAASRHDLNRRLIQENGKLKNINEYLNNQEINSCTIPPGLIRLHNESAKGKLKGAS